MKQKVLFSLLVTYGLVLIAITGPVKSQRGDGDDDFDDSGFDDSGYNSPQNQETDSSNQNPSNYSPQGESDLDDDDDDVDETHVSPQVAQDLNGNGNGNANGDNHHQQQLGYANSQYANAAPQHFYSAPNSVLLANVEPGQYHGNQNGHMRYRRSVQDELDSSEQETPLLRQKRHSKYIGPVYTYVKTDKHAHFKWGVKHKVGKKHYG